MTWTSQCALLFFSLSLAACCCGMTDAADSPSAVDFDRDVRPILSDRCFVCHGPDAQRREADLRLDIPEGAFAELDDSFYVVRPGSLEQSAVYQRTSTTDEDMRMPPVDSKLALSDSEKDIIKRWIEQGASWKQHWSFRLLRDPELPATQDKNWPRNPIDQFVLARLEAAGVKPTGIASRERLIRRVCFDLTGLPPTLEEVDAFLADQRDDAYERLVDRLLASPRFGERMAVQWLDVARYADTFGYQADVYRAVWPWRDWVVRALNDNLPFDQFVTWQLAGDLLPNPTQDQLLATAFNRHHRQTNEGGSVEEEFRAEYVADRVDTFGTAMLGLTLGCARCHDHKFDPVTQENYYQLSAFFNSIDESGLYSHFTNAVPTPSLVLMDQQQQSDYDALQQQIVTAEEQLQTVALQRQEAFQAWLRAGPHTPELPGLIGDFPLEEISKDTVVNRADPQQPGKVTESPEPVAGRVGGGLKLSGENTISVPAGGAFTRNDPFSISVWINSPDEKDRAVVFHRSRAWTDAGSRGYQLLIEDGYLSASLIHFWPGNAIRIRTHQKLAVNRWVHVTMAYDGSSRAAGLTLYVDGKREECITVRDNLCKNITGGGATTLDIGQRFRDRGFKHGLVDELKIFQRCLTPLEAAQLHDEHALSDLLNQPYERLDAQQSALLFDYYLRNYDTEFARQRDALIALRQRRSEAVDPVLEIMVMREMAEPRPTFLLQRGAYDAPAQQVEPDTPDCLPPWPAGQPRNRLGLARWLTDPQHPLLARVTVNRFWQALLGQGLVKTAEDLGSQGAAPTHPELLDWLARHFVDSGWDVKGLIKLVVTSSTYRQDSACPSELRSRDPENVLLARAPRYRLSAEMLRDNALCVSGLLVEKLGGAPVKPYQPLGLWKEKSGQVYQRDEGEGSHRRSLYTYWKRTSPPPAMMLLDAAKRDVCVARRQTTTTPLQALLLWNDPQYIEAARALAQRTMQESPNDIDRQLTAMFRRATSRAPNADEQAVLRALHTQQQAYFQQNEGNVDLFLGVGDLPRDEGLDGVALAAMTVVAEALLSFDETITKR